MGTSAPGAKRWSRGSAFAALATLMLASAFALLLQTWANGDPPPTSCTGSFGGSAEQLVVPSGATCTLEASATIKHNVVVEKDGSLSDQGASIGGNLQAKNPLGIQIGSSQQSVIGHDIQIKGLTGQIATGDNYICNAKIGHDLHFEQSSATAAPIVIGDAPDCSAGDNVGHDVHVQGNATKVDLSSSTIGHNLQVEKNTDGVNVSGNTIGHDLKVQNNSGGVVVSNNSIGHKAKCQGNKPSTEGEGNTVKGKGKAKGCPMAPPRPTVKKVSPNKGPATGGTAVTITGNGFTHATAVTFGPNEAASSKVESETKITATSPPGTGKVDVTVTTPKGTSATSDGDRYTYE
jgi:hypothetical protein